MHKHHANGALQFVQHSHYTTVGKEFWAFVVLAGIVLVIWAVAAPHKKRNDYR